MGSLNEKLKGGKTRYEGAPPVPQKSPKQIASEERHRKSQEPTTTDKAVAAVKKGAHKVGMAATRGAGLGPARGLRDVLMEAKDAIMGKKKDGESDG